MISNTILELLHQYGYLIFYFAFSLGPFGIPIPNEITIISGAILSHTGVINSWITILSSSIAKQLPYYPHSMKRLLGGIIKDQIDQFLFMF